MSTQVVLITGALTGIGRATAVAFAKKGANVVVAGRHDDEGDALATELRSFGSEAEFINADVRKEDDVHALVDKTVARFGRLDGRRNVRPLDPGRLARTRRARRPNPTSGGPVRGQAVVSRGESRVPGRLIRRHHEFVAALAYSRRPSRN